MIEFDNSLDVGTLVEGELEFKGDPLNYRVERRLRTEPFLGMKQPTPNGGFLGLECILIFDIPGKNITGYRYKLFIDGEEVLDGVVSGRGETEDLQVAMPFRGLRSYKIEILEPIPEPELDVPIEY